MNKTSKSLQTITDGDLCSGCGACAALGEEITMSLTGDGFLRPQQIYPVSADLDRKISDVCPGLKVTLGPSNTPTHPFWGPYISVHTGYSTDDMLRFTASSGGALSAVLVQLLASEEVDFVVNNGPDPNNPIGNITILSKTKSDLVDSAGSRYAPSAPLADLEGYLGTNERFAFVGKPCDIAALRQLAKIDPRIDRQIPYKISFFCAGVPSTKGAEEIVSKLGFAPEQLAAFRYRGNGWPGYAMARSSDGQEAKMTYNESWGSILTKHVQFRCKICADGVGSLADIVFGDAWHCDELGYPLFVEEAGRSLVIARSKRGKSLLDAALQQNKIALDELNIDEIDAMQPGQQSRKSAIAARLLALKFARKPYPAYDGLNILKAAKRASIYFLTRNFLGMLRRVMFQYPK